MKNNLPNNKFRKEMRKVIREKKKSLNMLGNIVFFGAITSMILFVLGIVLFIMFHATESMKYVRLSGLIVGNGFKIIGVISLIGIVAFIVRFVVAFQKYNMLNNLK